MKRLMFGIVTLTALILVLMTCKGSSPATPVPSMLDSPVLIAPGEAPLLLDDRPVCGLIAPQDDAPWRQYWRRYGEGGVSALLKDGAWLWVGTPAGLFRLDRQTLECTRVEMDGSESGVSLTGVYALIKGPGGCLWASGSGGVARYCPDAQSSALDWQPVRLDLYTADMAFDADGNLWTLRHYGRGGRIPVRYEGHTPPKGVWGGESVSYQDLPSDDCANWFSKSVSGMGYGNYQSSYFQSPQECQALAVWRERLQDVDLPEGLEYGASLFNLAVDEKSVWLFARRVRPRGDAPEQYALLRLGDDGWLTTMSWPFPQPYSGLPLVADEARGGAWVGSPDGLIFSDGQTVQRMPITARDLVRIGPQVLDLVQDKAGRLWAATEQGVYRFDELSDRWLPTEVEQAVLITADDRGGLWALPYGNVDLVSHFDGERWRHRRAAWPCSPRDIAADVGGGLWMTGHRCELMGFDGHQWVSYGGGQDIAGGLLDRSLDGTLYAAVRDDRIQRYDGKNWELLPAPDLHNHASVDALAVDRRDGVWVGYVQEPYLRHFDGKKWRDFSWEVATPALSLLVDRYGNLWVGGDGVLLHYDGKRWQRIAVDMWIRALAEDRQGRIWVGGNDGLYVYDPGRE